MPKPETTSPDQVRHRMELFLPAMVEANKIRPALTVSHFANANETIAANKGSVAATSHVSRSVAKNRRNQLTLGMTDIQVDAAKQDQVSCIFAMDGLVFNEDSKSGNPVSVFCESRQPMMVETIWNCIVSAPEGFVPLNFSRGFLQTPTIGGVLVAYCQGRQAKTLCAGRDFEGGTWEYEEEDGFGQLQTFINLWIVSQTINRNEHKEIFDTDTSVDKISKINGFQFVYGVPLLPSIQI